MGQAYSYKNTPTPEPIELLSNPQGPAHFVCKRNGPSPKVHAVFNTSSSIDGPKRWKRCGAFQFSDFPLSWISVVISAGKCIFRVLSVQANYHLFRWADGFGGSAVWSKINLKLLLMVLQRGKVVKVVYLFKGLGYEDKEDPPLPKVLKLGNSIAGSYLFQFLCPVMRSFCFGGDAEL